MHTETETVATFEATGTRTEELASAIAIIGMSGRFPGARDVDQYWENLATGKESISILSDDELRAEGVSSELAADPIYARGRGVLEDVDLFDAGYFGYTPGEAAIIDPQHRLFLEYSKAALDDAACTPEQFDGAIGVFAGMSTSTYLARVLADPNVKASMSAFQVHLANDKDSLATRVSYKLGLTGPSLSIQTSCSTSLVAVHVACQSLLSGECDVALAGGVSVRLPQRVGAVYQAGGITAPDGHCRAYDVKAQGTVVGSGLGVVVLKRLADALADGDAIRAVIRGSAVNNDGSEKVGYTAPSVAGQARVITEALAVAEVLPSTIGYVEGHGTGTPLGDPIEVAALTKAFRGGGDHRVGMCALGTVKANVGHLDAAAGVAGLIKAVLALEHRVIPPTPHFAQPNPALELDTSPFFVPQRAIPWSAVAAVPRRAGVSSFGIGGTNAHVVLEEAPAVASETGVREGEHQRDAELLVLSAKTPAALARARSALAAHLASHPSLSLADVACTLHIGRSVHSWRAAIVARDLAEAAERLKRLDDANGSMPAATESTTRPIAFLFPGQGAQQVGMGADLYAREPAFRRAMDECADHLRESLGCDLRSVLYPPEAERDACVARLSETAITQPALFAVEYALCQLWAEWGIQPSAMLGHSLGEYVAACRAGVFTLGDALRLVALRGRLMQGLSRGAMLAVPLGESGVADLLRAEPDLALAAVNGPRSCVVSGPVGAVEAFVARLGHQHIESRRLATSHAFHSEMMDPALDHFEAAVRKVPLAAPATPFLSNVTGRWITSGEATDPAYWTTHLRRTVRFGDGVASLLADGRFAFLEVGPGRSLSALVRQGAGFRAGTPVVSSLHADSSSEREAMLRALGALFVNGVPVDLNRLNPGTHRRRVHLPAYPFERERHWIERATSETTAATSDSRAVIGRRDAVPAAASATTAEFSAAAGADAPAARTAGADGDIANTIREVLSRLFGVSPTAVDAETTFLSMGAESLLLMQLARALEVRLGVAIPFQLLLGECSTVETLAAHIAAKLSARKVLPRPNSAPGTPEPLAAVQAGMGDVEISASVSGVEVLERIIAKQLDVMADQLRAIEAARSTVSSPGDRAVNAPSGEQSAERRESIRSSRVIDDRRTVNESSVLLARPFGPHQPVDGRLLTLNEHQQRHVDELVARHCTRTGNSKAVAQQYRRVFADNRASAGFRLDWKEMVYPLAVDRSAGAHIWDVDGNEYVDFTMGFGVHLFGHSPPFLMAALAEQMHAGMHLGPQNPLAGRVAELVCELTGMERAAFCNTGSEAVMTAVRIARAVTRRPRIAIFEGSYHGNFDGVLARGRGGSREGGVVPVAPGVPASIIADIEVLEYGDARALDVLRQRGSEFAAVLVEPVQSRRPDLQPREFLHELRKVTRQAGIALLFDEVITGFRLHPRGAQGWFAIQADMAIYGKVLGGGMPIGIVAGRSAFMDAVDGGTWQYGDLSVPTATQTFFAGTFSKNPLTMAAAAAVLAELKKRGPALQQELNARTSALVARLAAVVKSAGIPLRVANCGSLFRFVYPATARYMDLMFYHLLERGIYIWEGRTCFLSTAHTEPDLDRLVDGVAEAIGELQSGGFVSRPMPSLEISNIEREVPTTAAQRRVWVHAQFGLEAALAYVQVVSYRMTGSVDATALRQAFTTVVARHEALRTTLRADGERQRIHAPQPFDFPVKNNVNASTDVEVRRLVEDEARVPFDLTVDQPIRARLYSLTSGEYLLVVSVHHVLVDGQSAAIVLHELRECYAAATQNRAPNVPVPAQFGDYALSRGAGGEKRNEAANYWRTELAGAAPLALPRDRSTAPSNVHAGAHARLNVDAALAAHVRREAARRESTTFMLLLSAWLVVLHHWSEQEDLVVGILVSGRELGGDRYMVGHCVDVVPFRSRVTVETCVADFLADVRQRVLGAFEHRGFTLGDWADLAANATWPPVPTVTTCFNLEPRLGGAGERSPSASPELVPFEQPVVFAKFELGLNIADTGDELQLDCEYDPAAFTKASVERLLARYMNAVRHVSSGDEDARLADLDLIGVPERAEAIALAQGTACAATHALPSVVAQIAARVAERPHAVALRIGEDEVTFGAMAARAAQVGALLNQRGTIPEARVGLVLERSAAFVVAALGAMQSGAAFVPLDPRLPDMRLAGMLSDAAATTVLTTPDRVAPLRAALLDVGSSCDIVALEPDGQLNHASRSAANHEPALAMSDVTVHPDQSAYVIYTSGSTGQPKGVAVTHDGFRNFVHWCREAFAITAADRTACLCGEGFDAVVQELWPALCAGGSVQILPQLLPPDELRDWLIAHEIALAYVPAPVGEAILGLPADWERGTIRVLGLGGDRLTTRPVAGLPFAVTNLYGPTECTVCSVSGRVQSVAENQDGDSTPPIGRPISNTQGYVLDRVLRPTPIGAPGELCIGGAGVARGYLGRPALTAERFVPDPFTTKPGARLYRSGDRVRWRHDGQLEFLGRLDEQVKIRGVRIEPGEVEYALRGHPRVAEAVVVACSLGGDHKSQVHLVGYVVPRDAAVLADERQFAWQAELRGFLRRRLPDYMVPSAIISVGELPLTPNGKVDRQALPVPASTWAERDHVAPRTETERRLAEMWGAFLRLPRVGRDSAFLDLGGDSLRGIQLASRIRTAFGIEFGVRDLMQASTLSEVGARIDARMNEVADASADSNAHRESEPLTDDLLTLLESVERLSDGEVTALLTNHADSLQLAKPA